MNEPEPKVPPAAAYYAVAEVLGDRYFLQRGPNPGVGIGAGGVWLEAVDKADNRATYWLIPGVMCETVARSLAASSKTIATRVVAAPVMAP